MKTSQHISSSMHCGHRCTTATAYGAHTDAAHHHHFITTQQLLKSWGGQNTIHFAELSDRPPNLRMIIKPKWVNPAFRLSSHTVKTTLDHQRDHKEQQLILGCTLLCICQSCTSYSHSRKRCYFLSSFIFKQSKPWKGLHVGRFMQWDCYQK